MDSKKKIELTTRTRGLTASALALGAVVMGSVLPAHAQGNSTVINDEPLATRPNVKAKPNLLFVLDDSGSMNWSYMPDELGRSNNTTDEPYKSKYGYWSSQCNGTAFDPNQTYDPPDRSAPDANGNKTYANAAFASAWTDGFSQSGSIDLGAATYLTASSGTEVTPGNSSKTFYITDNLLGSGTFPIGTTVTAKSNSSSSTMTGTVSTWSKSGNTWTLTLTVTSSSGNKKSDWTISRKLADSSFYYRYKSNVGQQQAMNWTYIRSGNDIGDTDTNSTFYKECMSELGSTPGSGVFEMVQLSTASATVKQNYANWYAYYRKRTFMMRTSVGKAFSGLNDSYRVGFTTINSDSVSDTNARFQSVNVFDAAQRTKVYDKLYAAPADGNTPLRAALSKAGRYFAKKTDAADPVEYSCQRNFTLLSTDGYWNSSGSYQVNSSSSVGNTDGTEQRPMYDGTVSTTTVSRYEYKVGVYNSCNSSNQRRYTVYTQKQVFENGQWSNSGASEYACRQANYTLPTGQLVDAVDGTSVYSQEDSQTVTTGGSSDTLADVAQYYYKTRLRTTGLGNCNSAASGTSQDLCVDGYDATDADPVPYQNMKTYTIGLGLSGTLTYDPNYFTQTTGDFADLKSGQLNWPVASSGAKAQNIDDLWHAAVNGRGRYYSAKNASSLKAAIQGVINDITPEEGSASAASTSALELVAGEDNQVYQARYTTGHWTGDIRAYTLDHKTAEIGTTHIWSAQTKLTSNTVAANRKIYYKSPTSTTLRAFNWTNLNADGLGGNFSNLCSKAMKAMQCDDLKNDAAAANIGTNLVNYLRGERGFETANATAGTSQALYRPRVGVLGDIVNGAPVYVSKPPFNYTDAGYTAYVASKKSRKPVLYAAANDGMLHAFSAQKEDGGTELWAYVPREVMPEMYRLADTGYSTRHRYLVDGAPVVGDIKVGSTWKTILIGGLNKGGRSYYALDITDPEAPKALWEFSDTNLGLTFGNPVITKRKNGTWVVIFASGYNNISNGDGKGRLYVLNANTGENLLEIATTGGSDADPSGLAKINAWVDDPSDNTVKRVYGGDLQGGVWRFDIDSLVKPYEGAQLLARLQIDQSTPQPISTKPELFEVGGRPVVIVGTGRYLSSADVANTTQQSVYALKDPLTNTGISDVRNNNTLVRQTFTVSGNTASISDNPVTWATKNGWWVDFPSEHSGERMAVDMVMQFDTLSIATAIPASSDPCKPGGSSWRYYLNATNGNALDNPVGEMWSSNSLIVGQSWVKLSNGETRILRQGSDGTIRTERPPGGGTDSGQLNRSSWRELTD